MGNIPQKGFLIDPPPPPPTHPAHPKNYQKSKFCSDGRHVLRTFLSPRSSCVCVRDYPDFSPRNSLGEFLHFREILLPFTRGELHILRPAHRHSAYLDSVNFPTPSFCDAASMFRISSSVGSRTSYRRPSSYIRAFPPPQYLTY